MALVLRQGDADTDNNHVLPADQNVFVNGLAIGHLGDQVPNNGGTITGPSAQTVFANGKQVALNQDRDSIPNLPITATTTNVFAT